MVSKLKGDDERGGKERETTVCGSVGEGGIWGMNQEFLRRC